jgi:hypothetical protein
MMRLHEQHGIAAVTVLMVTAVLSLAGGVVLFTATAELESGARERRSEYAFAAAESGLDLAANYIETNPTFAKVSDPDGDGKLQVCLNNTLVEDDPLNIPCEVSITSPSNGVITHPPTGKPRIDYTVVSRAREGRTVTRVLAARYSALVRDLPYGMFVNGDVDLNGAPALLRASLLVNGTVFSREKLQTDADGNGLLDDPDLGWQYHASRISSDPDPTTSCKDGTVFVGCTGVFANAKIYEKNKEFVNNEIHGDPPTNVLPAAKYPHDRDIHQKKANPSKPSGYDPVVTIPVTDILEPMSDLKQIAQSQGLFFDLKDGTNTTTIFNPADIGATTQTFPKNVVIYIDADEGDTIGWKVNLIPDDPDSDIKYVNEAGEQVGSLSGVIVVRGGLLRFESGMQWSGAVFVPENEFRILGSVVCTCTVHAGGFAAQGGASTIQLLPAWFDNLPAGFVNVTRESFAECERFQGSALCPEDPLADLG